MSSDVIILPGNTDLNRGDQSLVWESARLFKEIDPVTNFVILESGTRKRDIELQSRQTKDKGYVFRSKILKHPSRYLPEHYDGAISYSLLNYIIWGVVSLWDLFSSSLLLSKWRILNSIGTKLLTAEESRTLNTFKNCKYVIVKGGGFIHSYGKITDFYTIYFMLFHVFLAQRYKKKVFILPNSIGPIKSKIGKRLTQRLLKNSTYISVRETVSGDFLRNELKIKSDVFPDLGFYNTPSSLDGKQYFENKEVPFNERKVVGITLRPYRFPNSTSPQKHYKAYIEELSLFVKKIIDDGYYVVLLAHTLGPSLHEDDSIALKDLMSKIDSSSKEHLLYEENYDLNCHDIQALYGSLDYLIGTRFHSVIFAFNQTVPSIAIGYGGNKSFGIMKEIGLDEYVFPIEDISCEKLYTSFCKLNVNNNSYRKRLLDYRRILDMKREELLKKISCLINEKS